MEGRTHTYLDQNFYIHLTHNVTCTYVLIVGNCTEFKSVNTHKMNKHWCSYQIFIVKIMLC